MTVRGKLVLKVLVVKVDAVLVEVFTNRKFSVTYVFGSTRQRCSL